jgi:hypothetical protein
MKRLLKKWLGIEQIEKDLNNFTTKQEVEEMLKIFREKYNKPYWKSIAKPMVDEYLKAKTTQIEKDKLL